MTVCMGAADNRDRGSGGSVIPVVGRWRQWSLYPMAFWRGEGASVVEFGYFASEPALIG